MPGPPLPDYRQARGVAPESATETFAAFCTEVQTGRRAGVPFRLRTGKRMPKRLAEVLIQFRAGPHQLFAPVGGAWAGRRLVSHRPPRGGVAL